MTALTKLLSPIFPLLLEFPSCLPPVLSPGSIPISRPTLNEQANSLLVRSGHVRSSHLPTPFLRHFFLFLPTSPASQNRSARAPWSVLLRLPRRDSSRSTTNSFRLRLGTRIPSSPLGDGSATVLRTLAANESSFQSREAARERTTPA